MVFRTQLKNTGYYLQDYTAPQPENHNPHFYCHGNHKSHTANTVFKHELLQIYVAIAENRL